MPQALLDFAKIEAGKLEIVSLHSTSRMCFNVGDIFAIVDAGKPEIKNQATLPTIKLRTTHTVDITTTAGGT